jgi:ubiquinone/menaquinone biosynthesis C-methylase UbiE
MPKLHANFAALLLLCATVTSFAQEPQTDAEIPPALETYMGRRIAVTMHYLGAPWLVRDNRENQERCSLMLANLGVKPGMTVCDMGCGNGFYAIQMAKMVGAEGTVLAVDIQPEMLKLLAERAAEAGVANVKPILGTIADPKLPEGTVDIILCADVYHEFSHPEQMLAAMRASLAPNGVVVLLEFRKEDPKVPIKPLHKMSKAQVNKELTANGFKLVKEFDKLPWQHMMFFGKDDSAQPASE